MVYVVHLEKNVNYHAYIGPCTVYTKRDTITVNFYKYCIRSISFVLGLSVHTSVCKTK